MANDPVNDGSESSSTEDDLSVFADEELQLPSGNSTTSQSTTTDTTTRTSQDAAEKNCRKECFVDEPSINTAIEEEEYEEQEDWKAWKETSIVLFCIIIMVLALILVHESGIVPKLGPTGEDDATGENGGDSYTTDEEGSSTPQAPTSDLFD
mmetsp:Transcript_15541/g.33859  ORF Transcript_15541/g.33859 Transcript_15541/m.33859 type:complete len:152 (+) Transcript_15541:209-664(+)|eukprot:CAMPEP_0168742140 /NCGR_PEP_ID=MMETSP0724-20121128/12882_1 /TAXON_ID=265536 /ORGANISM="Amphiprora sp., Strain CCMP467" /LENGTH=151 /DNA_ID=CAMNT_0008789679 /DNA_START=264 /DNA_END=719 /DNA_ORIENTATION=-